MFGDSFIHYLSYGATDQKTVIALSGNFDGLLVPGTVAAFQRDGTGGFVLSLSASSSTLDYVIDPRFPLFQQALTAPKKSHEALAELLGAPSLIRSTDPVPEDFTDALVRTIAESWANFNRGYPSAAAGKFAKYARRLQEDIEPKAEDARSPVAILPPYLMSHGADDGWWSVSKRLFDETVRANEGIVPCVRVVASSSVEVLQSHALDIEDDRLVIWVSGFDELKAPIEQLAAYGSATTLIASRGTRIFALYGGFFSVLLQNAGLGGSSHGIGYGEQRDWVELPQSGPPPARYYVPQLHRYLQPDEATRLLVADRRLAECDCPECNGDPPNTLEYHSLMKHSVHCRAREITEWSDLGLREAANRLDSDASQWHQILRATALPPVVISAAESRALHLGRWVNALMQLS